MSDPTEQAPSTGAVPLFFWITIMVLMGLGLGMWAPWRDRGDRHARASVAELMTRLEDPDPRQRTEAYVRLREWGSEAGPALLVAAQDAAHPGRREAIELLGRIGYEPARPHLLAMTDPAVAEERLVAVGRLGGAEGLRLLRETLAGREVPLKFAALRVLASYPDLPASVKDEALPYLEDPEWGLRDLAAAFLGYQRHAAATTPLIARLSDEHPDVRKRAAWALMQIGAPEGVEAVQAALERGAVVFDPEQR